MDDSNPDTEAIAVQGSRTVAVGRYEDIASHWIGQDTKVVNLENQTLMPRLIEAHSHPVMLVT